MLGGIFGNRKTNLLKSLPWHELQDGIMHNRDGSFEMSFEVLLPSTVFYSDYNQLLYGLKKGLEDELKEGMRLRFMLESGPANREVLTQIRKRVSTPEAELRYLLDKRADMLEQDWKNGDVRSWRAYCIVRVSTKAKKFFTLSQDTANERKSLCDAVRRKLSERFAAAGFSARPMDDQEMFRLVHRYMNPGQWHYEVPDYQRTWQRYSAKRVKKIPGFRPPTLRSQVAESKIDNRRPGHLTVGDHYVQMIAMNKQPDQRTFVTMMEEALKGGQKFFVVIDLYHQPSAKAADKARSRARRLETAAAQTDLYVDPETRYAANQSVGMVEHLVRTGDHLFLASVGFVLYDKELQNLNERTEHLYTRLQRVPGHPFRVLAQGLFTPFLDFAPFSGRDYSERVSLTTSNVTHLIPVDGPFLGAKEPVGVYRNRYFTTTKINPFSGTNYNATIIGGSGSGKTFFMNHMLSEFLSDGSTQVVIIDRGGGYLPLVDLVKGASIPLRPGGGTCINPFDIAPGAFEPTDGEKQNLLKVIRAMIPGEVGSQREIEDAVLMAAIDQVYKGAKYLDQETDTEVFKPPTLTDYFKKLQIITEVGEMHADEKTREMANDLAVRLQGWTGNTPLGKFVDGQTNVPLSNARVVYYDTEGIAQAGQLKIVGTLLIANLVWQRVRQRRGQKTLAILDEGWSMLKESPEAQAFVEEMYRRFRRYGAGIWSVSQSYRDFAHLPGIVGNAEMFFGLRVSDKEREFWASEMDLPKRTQEACRMVHQVPGRYSEAMCMFKRESGWEGGIIVIQPTLADYWCFTTNDDDMALREQTVAECGGDKFLGLKRLSGDELPLAA